MSASDAFRSRSMRRCSATGGFAVASAGMCTSPVVPPSAPEFSVVRLIRLPPLRNKMSLRDVLSFSYVADIDMRPSVVVLMVVSSVLPRYRPSVNRPLADITSDRVFAVLSAMAFVFT